MVLQHFVYYLVLFHYCIDSSFLFKLDISLFVSSMVSSIFLFLYSMYIICILTILMFTHWVIMLVICVDINSHYSIITLLYSKYLKKYYSLTYSYQVHHTKKLLCLLYWDQFKQFLFLVMSLTTLFLSL